MTALLLAVAEQLRHAQIDLQDHSLLGRMHLAERHCAGIRGVGVLAVAHQRGGEGRRAAVLPEAAQLERAAVGLLVRVLLPIVFRPNRTRHLLHIARDVFNRRRRRHLDRRVHQRLGFALVPPFRA